MKKEYSIIKHTIILTFISMILFTIYTIVNKNTDNKTSTIIYIIGMNLYGIFIMVNLIIHKNTFYGVSSFIMTFLFCEKGFYNFDNISLLFGLFIFTIIGFIIHIIKYKPKLYLGHFTPSTLFFILCISLSGIGVKEYDPNFQVSNPWFMPFIILGIGLIITLLLNYFECTNESTLEDVATYFKGFIVLIGYEIIFLILNLEGGFNYYLSTKSLGIGIGNMNTVAIILQLTIPFMLYFSFKKNKLINTIFFYLNLFLILLTISRGAILTTFVIVAIMIVYYFIKDFKKLKVNLIFHLSFLTFIIVSIILYFVKNPCNFEAFWERFLYGTNDLTGRKMIWKYVFEHWNINPIFGIGIVSNSYWHFHWEGFQFAHSTIIHTLWMSGIVGIIGLLVHLLDKYLYVIKEKKYVGLMLMFYLCAGLYGLFDVTYYNLHFTTYLLVIMFLYSSNVRADNFRKDDSICAE